MKKSYDMIVIGAGSGGLSVALGLHELQLSVLLVEKFEHNIGGECLNNGCVPSKAFIYASKIVGHASKARDFGIEIHGDINLEKVWDYVRTAQERIRDHENAKYFIKQGLDVLIGEARFVDKNKVEVNGKTYSGKRIAIATGSKPRKLEAPGIEKVAYFDNESIWDLNELPSRIMFVGAGPINMELGQAFCRLGSQVVMVESADQILNKEDPEISALVYGKCLELGMKFHFRTEVKEVIDEKTALLKSANQNLQEKFDIVVVGIGRRFDISGLNPEAAGIRLREDGRPVVDRYLQTTNKRIVTVGDIAGGPQFSHAAELQATTLIKNMFSPFKQRLTYKHFSWVTFTEPEVATFGLSAHQLHQQGIGYHKRVLDFKEDDRAITDDYQYGKLILYITKGKFPWSNPRLLGGSMAAPAAGEMVQELILANTEGLGIRSLFDKIYPYPTASRVNKSLVLKKYQESMTPWMKEILRFLYKLF